MASKGGKAFDLLDQLSFYGAQFFPPDFVANDLSRRICLCNSRRISGSYHCHPVNQLIHVIFVPTIWWSAVVWATYTGPLLPFTAAELLKPLGLTLPAFVADNLIFNLGFFAFLFYALYYLTLGDFVVAGTWNVIMFFLFLHANYFHAQYGANAWKYALVAHVLGWYMQIHPGHGIFEGRKPALLDNLFQSLVLAPLFVWFEVLFKIGYRKSFHQQLLKRIDERLAQVRAAEKAGGKKAQ